MADRDEDALDRHFLARAGLVVPQHHAGDFTLAQVGDLLDIRVPFKRNLRVGERLVLHDLRCAQSVAAMHDDDLRGKAREKDGFLQRGIAAADDSDWPAAKEITVARGARRHTVAEQSAL